MAKLTDKTTGEVEGSIGVTDTPESAPADGGNGGDNGGVTVITTDASEPGDIPEGFSEKTESTKAGKFSYNVTFLQANDFKALLGHANKVAAKANESLEEGEAPYTGESIITEWFNSLNKQGAMQGNKAAVRDAKATETQTAEEVRNEAIAKHQKNARGYLLGVLRGGRKSDGLTQKQQRELGEAVTKAMIANKGQISGEKINEIALSLGIDPALLAGAQD